MQASNYTFTSTVFIPLTSSAATTVTFTAAAPGPKVLTFSAECSVDAGAGNSSAWVDIDILHNGAAVSPTSGASDAFCTSNGTAGFDGYVRPSITVVLTATAGVNTVRVQGRLNNGATGGWLSDTALVIH